MSLAYLALSLVLIFGTAYSAYDTTCRYVKTETNMSATPSLWGFAYPVDVCRTYATTSATTYKKYVCDSSDQIQEESWDSATCDGNLLSTDAPSVAITSFNCLNTGDCKYATLKWYYNGCSDADNYNEEPIIPDVCVEGLIPFDYSFEIQCSESPSDVSLHYIAETAALCNSTATSSASVTASCTEIHTIVSYAELKSWHATSACLTKSYTTTTTSSPTQEPTTVPIATEMPSKTPTTSPVEEETTESPEEDEDPGDDDDLTNIEKWQDFGSWSDMHYIVAISAIVLLLVLCCCTIACCIKCCKKKDDGWYDSRQY